MYKNFFTTLASPGVLIKNIDYPIQSFLFVLPYLFALQDTPDSSSTLLFQFSNWSFLQIMHLLKKTISGQILKLIGTV